MGPTKSSLKVQSPKVTSPCSTTQVLGHYGIEQSFPQLLWTPLATCLGPTPSGQTPVFFPVQHTQWKGTHQIPGTDRAHMLDNMVEKGVIVTCFPSNRVGIFANFIPASLIVPYVYASTLMNLNKALVWEHYKAPTLDEISHCLSGVTCFSKFDAKDGFKSIHLEWEIFIPDHFQHASCSRYRFLHMPFGLKMSQGHLSDVNGPGNRLFTWHYCHTWWYMHLRSYPWRAWLAPLVPDGDFPGIWHCLQ